MADEQREIERLKAENEEIRQHCVTHDTCKVVIEQTRKDTAREVFDLLRNSVSLEVSDSLSIADLEYYAGYFGVDVKDGAE